MGMGMRKEGGGILSVYERSGGETDNRCTHTLKVCSVASVVVKGTEGQGSDICEPFRQRRRDQKTVGQAYRGAVISEL